MFKFSFNQFAYPEKKLTIDEMLAKFIDEGIKEKEEAQQQKFLDNLRQLHINIPFIEALVQMPKYAKYLKNLLTNKSKLEEACTVMMNERCSAVLLNKLPSKEKDPRSFTIPWQISDLHIDNALADLRASISLMPYSMYERLGLGEPKPTKIILELVDMSIQYPRGLVKNVLIKVDKFVLPVDFVILDMPEDSTIPITLGRPFQATAHAMIDDDECYSIDDLDETINEETQLLLENEQVASFLLNNLEKTISQEDQESYNSIVLEKRKGVIAWKMHLNPKVQEVVKNEIVKLLDSGLIYPISDSSWVSPIYVVPKKGGMTVVLNDNNELIPSRVVTGWEFALTIVN
ncbi:DNA-directed DNA polymerase [Tanacetum coccineum]